MEAAMTYEEMRKKAKAKLILIHGLEEPTEQEVSIYCLYGENAPFLQGREQAQVANKSTGGTRMKDIQEVLCKLRGTARLMTMLCDTVSVEAKPEDSKNLEALFAVEEMLKSNIRDLEQVVNK